MEYYIELDEKMQEYFKEGAVIYPDRDRCLAVARQEKFERMVNQIQDGKDSFRMKLLRHLVGASVYVEETEKCLILPESLIRYMNPGPEADPVFLISEAEGRKDADYLIITMAAGKEISGRETE